MRQSRRWRRHFSGDNLLAKLKFINRPKRQAGRQAGRQGNACCGCCLIFSVLWQGAPCNTNTHTPHNKAEHKNQAGRGRRGAEIEAMATTGT